MKFILITTVMLITLLGSMILFYQFTHSPALQAQRPLPYAVLISTNLVRQNCSCGFCDPSRGIAVPEHINQLGYDLRLQVSTNYLPVVYR